ncbi:MAG: DUF2336 domain-containing protein [Pseudolabrys sp.]|nr:DUF2336 domain-containing protein [Pseudolabrys sp.]
MAKPAVPPPLDSLVDLACRDGVDIRPTLLRVLTDLYVEQPRHSAEEEIQYVELALGLIDKVDAATRAAVMARLSAYRGAPAAVLRHLESRGAGAAAELPRTPPDDKALADLFFDAGAADRRLILVNLDVVAGRAPAPAPEETIQALEAAALAHRAADFARVLAKALGVRDALARRIVDDEQGEPLAVAAKALGMPPAVFQRVLLTLNPAIARSVARVHALSALYDDITAAAAAHMVDIWRKAAARRPTHAPHLWDDEKRAARSLAHPAPRPAPRRQNDWLQAQPRARAGTGRSD